jgi:sporulation protein YlmC with PRC-barrel domain
MAASDDDAPDHNTEFFDYRHEMISSLRVEGTPVFDSTGTKLGTVHSLMIGKADGQVRYAVLGFSTLFGFHSRVHPIPWQLLRYNIDLGGYVVDLTKEQLKTAPSLTLDETDRPIDRAQEEELTSYWRVTPWWGL